MISEDERLTICRECKCYIKEEDALARHYPTASKYHEVCMCLSKSLDKGDDEFYCEKHIAYVIARTRREVLEEIIANSKPACLGWYIIPIGYMENQLREARKEG